MAIMWLFQSMDLMIFHPKHVPKYLSALHLCNPSPNWIPNITQILFIAVLSFFCTRIVASTSIHTFVLATFIKPIGLWISSGSPWFFLSSWGVKFAICQEHNHVSINKSDDTLRVKMIWPSLALISHIFKIATLITISVLVNFCLCWKHTCHLRKCNEFTKFAIIICIRGFVNMYCKGSRGFCFGANQKLGYFEPQSYPWYVLGKDT